MPFDEPQTLTSTDVVSWLASRERMHAPDRNRLTCELTYATGATLPYDAERLDATSAAIERAIHEGMIRPDNAYPTALLRPTEAGLREHRRSPSRVPSVPLAAIKTPNRCRAEMTFAQCSLNEMIDGGALSILGLPLSDPEDTALIDGVYEQWEHRGWISVSQAYALAWRLARNGHPNLFQDDSGPKPRLVPRIPEADPMLMVGVARPEWRANASRLRDLRAETRSKVRDAYGMLAPCLEALAKDALDVSRERIAQVRAMAADPAVTNDIIRLGARIGVTIVDKSINVAAAGGGPWVVTACVAAVLFDQPPACVWPVRSTKNVEDEERLWRKIIDARCALGIEPRIAPDDCPSDPRHTIVTILNRLAEASARFPTSLPLAEAPHPEYDFRMRFPAMLWDFTGGRAGLGLLLMRSDPGMLMTLVDACIVLGDAFRTMLNDDAAAIDRDLQCLRDAKMDLMGMFPDPIVRHRAHSLKPGRRIGLFDSVAFPSLPPLGPPRKMRSSSTAAHREGNGDEHPYRQHPRRLCTPPGPP